MPPLPPFLEGIVSVIAMVAAGVVAASRDVLRGLLDRVRRGRGGAAKSKRRWSRFFFWCTSLVLFLTCIGVLATINEWPKPLSVTLAVAAALLSLSLLVSRPDLKIAALNSWVKEAERFLLETELALADLAGDEVDEVALERVRARIQESYQRLLDQPDAPITPPIT